MKKEIRFIIMAGGFQESSLLIPHALVPLGHHPMICILVKTILSLDQDITIHVIASLPHQALFEREMKRWYPSAVIEVFGATGSTPSASLHQFLFAKQWDPEVSCYILQSNAPLLSLGTLDHFLRVSAKASSAVAGIPRTKWNEDRGLHHLVINEEEGRVLAIEKTPFTDVGFLSVAKFPTRLLLEHLPVCASYHEMVARLEEKPVLVRVPSFPVELDSLQIRSPADKTFVEHKFMEKQHADYLTQCYCIWKECRNLEARIEALESPQRKSDLSVPRGIKE